jgi:hypothetical protein
MQQRGSPPVSPERESAAGTPSWQAISEIDLAHPFYFDHPLDHVPGILLIVQLLGLVRQAVRQSEPALAVSADRGRLRASFSFPRFCELDSETELRVWPARPPRQWTLVAEQGLVPACAGSATFLPSAALAAGGPVPAYRSAPSKQPVSRHLVHRHRAENVLVGEASQEEAGPVRCAVLSPSSSDQLFAVLGGAERTPEELIEAARQAVVMLWCTVYQWPVDVRLTLNEVSAELPVSVHRDIPLELRWWPQEVKGNKAVTSFELVAGSDTPERIGSITFATQAWSERAWERVRSTQRRAAAAAGETRC